MSENVTGVLAGFAASLQYDNLPGQVRDHCKNVLLDTLACAVAGHRGEETQKLAALASGLAQSSESSVIGGDRLSLAGATLLNGYLVTSNPAASATMRSRPEAPSRSAMAKAAGITSGVTWVSVERWMSHMVTAVTR